MYIYIYIYIYAWLKSVVLVLKSILHCRTQVGSASLGDIMFVIPEHNLLARTSRERVEFADCAPLHMQSTEAHDEYRNEKNRRNQTSSLSKC